MSNPTAFLSYAKEDLVSARRLYNALRKAGISVWFDEESLHPGQPVDTAIKRAIRESRYFLALVSSKSIAKVGYVNFELYEAVEQSKKYSPDVAYLLPVRLDNCTPAHERLQGIHWTDLFDNPETGGNWKTGIEKLIRFLAPQPQPAVVRTNGLYVAETEGDVYRFYNLRFFADGTVVAASSDWPPDYLAPHMTPESPYMSVGKYAVDGTRIEFSTKSAQGIVEYKGHLTPHTLILRKRSQITQHRDAHEYTFRQVTGLKVEAPQPDALKGTRRKRRAP